MGLEVGDGAKDGPALAGCEAWAMSFDIPRTLLPHLPPRGWTEPRACHQARGAQQSCGELFSRYSSIQDGSPASRLQGPLGNASLSLLF